MKKQLRADFSCGPLLCTRRCPNALKVCSSLFVMLCKPHQMTCFKCLVVPSVGKIHRVFTLPPYGSVSANRTGAQAGFWNSMREPFSTCKECRSSARPTCNLAQDGAEGAALLPA